MLLVRPVLGAALISTWLALTCGGLAAQAMPKSGDGSSCGAAAARVAGKNSASGVAAQHRWIAQKYPGARMVRSAVVEQGGSIYDRMTLQLASGETKSVCFDISDYFGRF